MDFPSCTFTDRWTFLILPHSLMRTVLSFPLVSILFTFMSVSAHAQSEPAVKLAQAVEQRESIPDSTVEKYRSLLIGAARYSESRSAVADSLIEGIQDLRKYGLSTRVTELLSINGLGGLISRDRPFEEILDIYLEYRTNKGLSHEEALENIKSR